MITTTYTVAQSDLYILDCMPNCQSLCSCKDSAIICDSMPRKKRPDPKLFESIRKPTAPPTQKFGDEKSESKIHPARRKAKHKKKEHSDGDLS